MAIWSQALRRATDQTRQKMRGLLLGQSKLATHFPPASPHKSLMEAFADSGDTSP